MDGKQNRCFSLQNKVMLTNDAPAEFRVLGPLSDIEEFYKAFGIKPGDAMYRADNVEMKIW